MKKNRVMTCLAAGVCILAVSVTAAFGSVNGYANYKTAVKALALDVDNVSASGTFRFTYDGTEVVNGQLEYAKDGANDSNHVQTLAGGRVVNENWNTTLDGVTTWFNKEDDHYYQASAGTGGETGHGLLGLTADDEMSKRMFTFLEMGADTVMGDLKNNVVEIGSENGDVTYQLDISSTQVPSVVNAGLSLMAYAISDSAKHTSYVEYENYNQSCIRYYEEQTGETLPQDFKTFYLGEAYDEAAWEQYQDVIERVDEVTGEYMSHFYDDLEKEMEKAGTEGGVLYVTVDGDETFYPDAASFRAAQNAGEEADPTADLETFIGEDLTLKNVHFTFSINKAGQLTANHCEATFDTVDQDGAHHAMVMEADVSLGDYGTSVVQPLDTGDRTPYEMQ